MMVKNVIITVGGTHGGVGTITLAVNIAAAWAMQGRDVLLIDADRQQMVLAPKLINLRPTGS